MQRSTVKSLSLQDLVNARPPFFRRIFETAKTGLMIWGAISLSAAAGYSAFYLQGIPDEPVLASEADAASEDSDAEVPKSIAEIAGEAQEPATASESMTEIALARLPRPRPDEPIITGSIERAADGQYTRLSRRDRTMDPCEAWNSLGTPFRVRCVQERREPVYYSPSYYPPSANRW